MGTFWTFGQISFRTRPSSECCPKKLDWARVECGNNGQKQQPQQSLRSGGGIDKSMRMLLLFCYFNSLHSSIRPRNSLLIRQKHLKTVSLYQILFLIWWRTKSFLPFNCKRGSTDQLRGEFSVQFRLWEGKERKPERERISHLTSFINHFILILSSSNDRY